MTCKLVEMMSMWDSPAVFWSRCVVCYTGLGPFATWGEAQRARELHCEKDAETLDSEVEGGYIEPEAGGRNGQN